MENSTTTSSPIERCPQEILEDIFLECLPSTHEADRLLTPLRISHVCSWWRTVAFHLPQLWRSLHLSMNSKKMTKYELFGLDDARPRVSGNSRKLAKLYTDNARGHTLSLHFEIQILCHGMGNILTTYADRLRFLRLQVTPTYAGNYAGADVLGPFVNLPASSIDQLESLHLTWTYSSTVRYNTIRTFTLASRLRKLRLGFGSADGADALLEPPFNSYYFMIPWAQLTHLCMDNISVETWDDLLHSCPKLQECLVTFSSFSHNTSTFTLQSPSTISHPTVIPHLRKLGINIGRSGGLFSFEHLDMPALDTLQISAKPWTRNERARKFQWRDPLVPSFQWFKNLSTLTVSLQDMSTLIEDFIGILPHAISLKNLSVFYIENGSGVEMILQSLTYDPALCEEESGGQVALPKLEFLKLEMANTYDLRPATPSLPGSIRDFVKRRWWGKHDERDSDHRRTARLASCEIGMVFFRKRGAKSFFGDVEQAVSQFRTQGLRVRVYESRCNWSYDQMTQDWW
ncbi:hypothetical protein AX15_001906 [Amanita polypyramis BW_CC]|nr:hypothetical protein AX15_001906 [Amanita polypyramis BW_CC]